MTIHAQHFHFGKLKSRIIRRDESLHHFLYNHHYLYSDVLLYYSDFDVLFHYLYLNIFFYQLLPPELSSLSVTDWVWGNNGVEYTKYTVGLYTVG